MLYQMTPDLETGNALIDSEHRQLFEAINNLLSACAGGKGRAEIEKTTEFLYNYTAKHFSDEEKLQIQTHYPDYTNHKAYHEAFKKTVANLNQKLREQGPTIVLVGEVNNAVAGWLINHIKKEDTKIAAHIKSQK